MRLAALEQECAVQRELGWGEDTAVVVWGEQLADTHKVEVVGML
jgi:hypothetical protein